METLEWNRSIAIRQVRRDVWRYLTGAVEEEDDERLLVVAAALLQLSEHELRTLAQIHFSRSEEVGRLLASMPRLTRRLATTTREELEVADGRIRGSVRWGETYARRAATGARRIYVTAASQRAFVTPENHLLAFVLAAIAAQGADLPWDDAARGSLARTIARHVAEATRWLQLTTLREVPRTIPPPRTVSRVRAGRARERYADVLSVWDLYQAYVERLDPVALREAIQDHALAHSRDDVLLELQCAFDTIKILRRAGWVARPTGLIETGVVFGGRRGEERVDVTYQRTPAALASISRYPRAAGAHGFRRDQLRTDLAIRHESGGATRWMVVEVKSGGGEDRGPALARSALRDLLMYRWSYDEVLSRQAPGVFGIGYVWGRGLRPVDSDGIVLCTPDTLREALRRAGLV